MWGWGFEAAGRDKVGMRALIAVSPGFIKRTPLVSIVIYEQTITHPISQLARFPLRSNENVKFCSFLTTTCLAKSITVLNLRQ